MRHVLYCDTVGRIGSVGLLLLRLAMGAAFVLHGWGKIQNPTAWMGPQAPVPAVFQTLAAVAEFGGGMALIVGLLTRLAALGIACNMCVALAMVHLPHHDPFVYMPHGDHAAPIGPSYELAAVYLACAVVFLLLGPGRASLDALFFREPMAAKPGETG